MKYSYLKKKKVLVDGAMTGDSQNEWIVCYVFFNNLVGNNTNIRFKKWL